MLALNSGHSNSGYNRTARSVVLIPECPELGVIEHANCVAGRTYRPFGV